jgi:hypothetical protein
VSRLGETIAEAYQRKALQRQVVRGIVGMLRKRL